MDKRRKRKRERSSTNMETSAEKRIKAGAKDENRKQGWPSSLSGGQCKAGLYPTRT